MTMIRLLIILHLLDVWTTRLGLNAGYREMNPFMEPIAHDAKLLLLSKAVGIVFILFLLSRVRLRERRWLWGMVLVLSSVGFVNNLLVLA